MTSLLSGKVEINCVGRLPELLTEQKSCQEQDAHNLRGLSMGTSKLEVEGWKEKSYSYKTTLKP